MKSFIFYFFSILIINISLQEYKENYHYQTSPKKKLSNYSQVVIDQGYKLKYQVDAFSTNVYGNRWHTTSSYWTFIRWIVSIKILIWSSGEAILSRSYFGRVFLGLFGRSLTPLVTATTSYSNQGWFWSLYLRELGWELCRLFWWESWELGVLGGVVGGFLPPPSNNGWKDSLEELLWIWSKCYLKPWKCFSIKYSSEWIA